MTDQHFKGTVDNNINNYQITSVIRRESREVHNYPFLPPETLGEIFNYVGDDIKSLHSCLLVNKMWCESAALILWRQPFDISSIMASADLVTVYFLFFSDEIKKFLLTSVPNGLSNLLSNRPSLNYLSYLRYVDFKKVYKAVRMWLRCKTLYEPLSIEFKKKQIALANRIVTELGKIFTTGYARLDRLSLCVDMKYFEYNPIDSEEDCLSWPCYPGACTALSELREFLCGGQFVKDKILHTMAGICKDIEVLTIHESADTSPKMLTEFINAQRRLLKFTLTNWSGDTLEILSSLRRQARTLRHIELIRCTFPKNEDYTKLFYGLAECRNLQTLKLSQCQHLSTKLMKPLAEASFEKLQTFIIDTEAVPDPPTTEIKNIIQNSKDSLIEIGLSVNLSLYVDIMETIGSCCPNLLKLSVTIERDYEMQQLIALFKSCTKLVELRIPRKWKLFEVKRSLSELGNVLPSTLQRLELDGLRFSHEIWEEFLDICPGSIDHFTFNCFNKSIFVNTVQKYGKRYGRCVKNDEILGQFYLPVQISVELH
ncbi:16992_t:CDS:1 [Funneliformis geosporum]|nr:16992_t:CDS:1 [Funneliformis geosporum]